MLLQSEVTLVSVCFALCVPRVCSCMMVARLYACVSVYVKNEFFFLKTFYDLKQSLSWKCVALRLWSSLFFLLPFLISPFFNPAKIERKKNQNVFVRFLLFFCFCTAGQPTTTKNINSAAKVKHTIREQFSSCGFIVVDSVFYWFKCHIK